MEDKRYQMVMTNREHVEIEGVQHVVSFDEDEIVLDTELGQLLLKGQYMHITQLNLETGKLEVTGKIKSMDYDEEGSSRGIKNKGKGILDRILK